MSDMAARRCLFALLSLSVLAASDAGLLVVNVSEDGHNRPECLRGLANCSTLGYALKAIANASNGTEINVWYDHVVNDSTIILERALDVRIVGRVPGRRSVVTCRGPGNGLGFSHSRNITIVGISWINCSLSHPTSATIRTYPYNHTAYSAVFLHNCTDLRISDCSFTSAYGSGVSLFNVAGTVSVEWSNFTDNNVNANKCPEYVNSSVDDVNMRDCSPQATGLYIEFMYCPSFSPCSAPFSSMRDTSYSISHCNFERNVNPQAFGAFTTRVDKSEHWPFGRGGGLAIVMRSYVVANNTFTIQHCNFTNNRALWAAGVFVKILSSYPYSNHMEIEYCNFTENNASFSGGGMRIGMLTQTKSSVKNLTPNIVQLNFVTFIKNHAAWGGGLSIYANPTEKTRFSLNASSCGWLHNKALNASSAVGITRWNEQGNASFTVDRYFFIDCWFTGNMLIVPLSGDIRLHGFGAFYTEGIPIVFMGETSFHRNRASALFISSTAVTFYGNVNFTNGHALQGGGIHLTGSSWITLTNGVNIHFVNNTALQTGGAIHYTFPPSLALSDSQDCFLRYYDPKNIHVPLVDWSVNVTFIDNEANGAGHAVFLTDPTECIWPEEDGGSPFNRLRTDKFIYRQKQTDLVVATSAQKLNFSSASQSLKRVNGWWTYSISPGEPFDLHVTAKDHYNQVITTVFSISCESLTDYKHGKFVTEQTYCHNKSGSDYQIVGGNVFTANTNMSSLQLTAPQSDSADHDNFALLFTTFDDYLVIGALRINFVPCKLGFTYNPASHKCECVKTKHLSCLLERTTSRETPCLKGMYWYGDISNTGNTSNTSNTSKFGIKECPEWACKPCEDYCDSFDLGCKIPNNSDGFCFHGRTGHLCSQCLPPLALTYDAYSCSECSTGKKVGLALLIIAYWVAIVTEIVLLVKFNVAMGSAGVYAILYFYSVVVYIIPRNFPLRLGTFFYVLSAFTQLDPYFLSYSQFCLFDSATNIHYQAIHFIHPVIISLILYLLYRIDRSDCCRCRFKFLAGESAVQVVCILILISFTSIAGTAMRLLDPLTFVDAVTDNIDYSQVFVRVQPSTPYMDPRGHLPFALMAIFAEFGLVIPFTVFMLIAPWLGKHVNLTKIKPLLDGFQSCYRDKHRYFAGVYLLARQLLFLTSISAINLQLTIYLQQLISLILLALHTYIQPYEKQWLNTVDMLILSAISILTFTVGSTAESGFDQSEMVRKVIIVLLAFAPMAYVLAAFLRRLYKKLILKCPKVRSETLTAHERAFSINGVDTSQISEDDLPPLRSEEEYKPMRRMAGEKEKLLPRGSVYKPEGSTPVRSVSVPTDMGTRHAPYQSRAAPLLKTALTE